MVEQPVLVDNDCYVMQYVQGVILEYNEIEQGKGEPVSEVPSTDQQYQNVTAEFHSNDSGNVFVCSSCGLNTMREGNDRTHEKRMTALFYPIDTCFYCTGVPNRHICAKNFIPLARRY